MNNRIILIGSTGFLGKNIANNFKKNLVKFNSKNLNLKKIHNIKKVATKFKNSTIIYAAGMKRTRGDNFQNFNLNLKLFNNLFGFFFENKPKKLIFLSSAEVYGFYKGKKKINENTNLKPATMYSKSKMIQENIIKFFAPKIGYNYIILRLPGVYGKDIENQNIISKLVGALNKKKYFELKTSGNELRDYIYVNDVAKIIYKLTKKKLNNLILNLATGKSFKILQIIKYIEKNFKKKINIKKIINKKNEEYNLKYSNNRFNKILPNYNFQCLDKFDFKKEFQK